MIYFKKGLHKKAVLILGNLITIEIFDIFQTWQLSSASVKVVIETFLVAMKEDIHLTSNQKFPKLYSKSINKTLKGN